MNAVPPQTLQAISSAKYIKIQSFFCTIITEPACPTMEVKVREIDRILGLNGEWEESFSREVNKEKLTPLIYTPNWDFNWPFKYSITEDLNST